MSVVDYALYSLDVYQRGKDLQKGGLTDKLGSKFNNSTILKVHSERELTDGFYAIAYDAGDEIIIAYRGTDGEFNDVLNGWGGGAGIWSNDQMQLGIEFYQDIKAQNPNKTITLTGHSLGGGIAGFVSSITGSKAYVFDNMPYQVSAQLAYFTAKAAESATKNTGFTAQELSEIFESTDGIELFGGVDIVGNTGEVQIDVGIEGFNPVSFYLDTVTDFFALAESYYDGIQVLPPSLVADVNAYAIEGEILSALRILASSDYDTNYSDAYFGSTYRDDLSAINEFIESGLKGFGTILSSEVGDDAWQAIQTALTSVGSSALSATLDLLGVFKHQSVALNVATHYLDEHYTTNQKQDIAFLGGSLYSHLFANDIANTVGVRSDAAGLVLFNQIAYTAIDSNNTENAPYGNTALKALFNDAADAGEILERADYNFNLGFTNSDYEVRGALGGSIVQFAGELAHSKNTNPEMLEGFIRTDGDRLISIDFSEALWKSASGKGSYDTSSISGLDSLIDRFDYDDLGYYNSHFERLHFIADEKLSHGMFVDLREVNDSYVVNGTTYKSTDGKSDVIIGTKYDDTFISSSRNEVFDGNDPLFGDKDMVAFSGHCSEYDITVEEGGLLSDRVVTITHTRGSKKDGTDTLVGIEYAQFSNMKLDLTKEKINCAQDIVFVLDGVDRNITWTPMHPDGTVEGGEHKASVETAMYAVITSVLQDLLGYVIDPHKENYTDINGSNNRYGVIWFERSSANVVSTFDQNSSREDLAPRFDDLPAREGSVNLGLLKALNGDVGQWRENAERKIILIGDSPASDSDSIEAIEQLQNDYESTFGSKIPIHTIEMSIRNSMPNYAELATASGINQIVSILLASPIRSFYGYVAGETFKKVANILSTQYEYAGSTLDDEIEGNFENNLLSGYEGNDKLNGLAGDDILKGGLGDDEYYFEEGDGNNIIIEDGGFDTIDLGEGIKSEDVTYSRDGNDLKVEIASGFVIRDFFDGEEHVVEEVTFADGTTFDLTSQLSLLEDAEPDNEAGGGASTITVQSVLAGTGTFDPSLPGGVDGTVVLEDQKNAALLYEVYLSEAAPENGIDVTLTFSDNEAIFGIDTSTNIVIDTGNGFEVVNATPVEGNGTTSYLINISEGVEKLTISVPVINDDIEEALETLLFTASTNNNNASNPMPEATTGYIIDDDVEVYVDAVKAGVQPQNQPQAAVQGQDVMEGEALLFKVGLSTIAQEGGEIVTLTFTGDGVIFGDDTGSDIEVDFGDGYGFVSVTATASLSGDDKTTYALLVPAGIVDFIIKVPTTEDNIQELSESLSFTASTLYSTGDHAVPKAVIATIHDAVITGTESDDVFSVSVASTRAVKQEVDGGEGSDIVELEFTAAQVTGATREVDGDVVIKTGEGSVTLKNIENVTFQNEPLTAIETIIDLHNANAPRFRVIGTDGQVIEATPTEYDGVVSYLEYQLLGDVNGNVVVASDYNDFLNLLDGDDAASGGAGNDVLDGGTGSNFLEGGEGQDTFFLDGRSGAITWSTITDFNGDSVNIWGWVEGVSQLLVTDENAGAQGYEGLTFHYDLDADGNIDTSITFSGLSQADAPNSSSEIVADTGYLLFA